jgi:DNA-binding MarR family transcriptional regulator
VLPARTVSGGEHGRHGGVLLELTAAGRARLEDYIDASAARERALLADLSLSERRQLNQLLSRLLVCLERQGADADRSLP